MFESLSPRWRVVLRGLAAGAVYSLTWHACCFLLFNNYSVELCFSIFAICVILSCFLLQYRSKKPGWSFLIAVILSLGVNVFSFVSLDSSASLYGPNGYWFFSGILILFLFQLMVVAKGLTGLILLLFWLIRRRRRNPETGGDDTGPAAM